MTKPQNAESPRWQAEAPADRTHSVIDFATARDSGKAVAALKARFALAGHQVHEGGNNDFIVVKCDWGMSRHCPDLAALRMFAQVVGVSNG